MFPAYAGGLYEQNGTIMIVSRGLARESTPVPRWYNRPEMVIIELF
jgi:predicted MPP superfamily phosphohydrolase